MPEGSYLETVLATPLLWRAVVAGGLAGVCCAVFSPMVVLRRMAFIGDGMAHAAFGGIGLGVFVLAARFDDIRVELITLGFCLALGLAVAIVSRRSETEHLSEDSAIGIAFSVSMALGALLIGLHQQRHPQYVSSIDAYLFGSVVNISASDLWFLSVLTLILGVGLLLFWKEMLFYIFDEKLAEVAGLNVGLIHHLFLLLLVFTVVISARIVGIVLVSASLILPGVTALRLCRRLHHAILLSAALGWGSFELGLYLAYRFGRVQPGAAIVLVQFAVLIAGVVLSRLRQTPRSA